MKNKNLAQRGVLDDPTSHVEFLTYVLNEGAKDAEKVKMALSYISNIEKSIGQKDANSNYSITIGFSAKAWPILFPKSPMPQLLKVFPEMKEGPRHFPSTPGDLFFMIKSTRQDLNYQGAKYLRAAFLPIADIIDDVQCFKYLDDRDLIDFVDGTENPKGNERVHWVINEEEPYNGGSYLTVQKYIDRQEKWDALSTEEQEGVIGRTKMDDIEIEDEKKKPYAHNVKSKVTIEGEEKKMFRQNRVFGNSIEHGTMFVGFAADPNVIETSLKQMIFADEKGYYDHLLDFVEARQGMNFFVPPIPFIQEFLE